MKNLLFFVLLSAAITFGQTMDWKSLVGKRVVVRRLLCEPGAVKQVPSGYISKQATIIAVKPREVAPDVLDRFSSQSSEELNTAIVTAQFEDGTKADTCFPVLRSSLPTYFDIIENEPAAALKSTSEGRVQPSATLGTAPAPLIPSWLIISDKFQRLYNWVQMTVVVILSSVLAWLIVRVYRQKLSRTAVLVRVLALQVVVIGVCVGLDSLLDTRYPIIFAIVTTGVMTFYALLLHFVELAPERPLRDADIRMALAISITLMYLVLVGYGVFLNEKEMGPLSASLMSSFSSVVGVVIASYFGASAYVETRRTATRTSPTSDTSQDKGQQELVAKEK